MTLKNTVVAISFSVLALALCTEGLAQNKRPGRRVFQFLGLGQGGGNHVCSPGTDTSYYNPYTAHNSTLISDAIHTAPPNYWAYSDHKGSAPILFDRQTPRTPGKQDAPGPRDQNLEEQPESKLDRLKSVYQWPSYNSPRVQNAIRASTQAVPRNTIFKTIPNHQIERLQISDEN